MRLREYLNFRRQDLVKYVQKGKNPVFGYPLLDLELEREEKKREVQEILCDLVFNGDAKVNTVLDTIEKH